VFVKGGRGFGCGVDRTQFCVESFVGDVYKDAPDTESEMFKVDIMRSKYKSRIFFFMFFFYERSLCLNEYALKKFWLRHCSVRYTYIIYIYIIRIYLFHCDSIGAVCMYI